MTVLIPAERIQSCVAQLGARIDADYAGRPLLLVAVLKGACMLIADLARHLTGPVEFDFMMVSDYLSGAVQIVKDLDRPIAGLDVLVVSDVVDSGRTLRAVLGMLQPRQPASVAILVLLAKPDPQGVRADLPIRYQGFEVPDVFVVGYGIDHRERHRTLPHIATPEVTR